MNTSRTAGLLSLLSAAGLALAACGPGGGYGSAGTTSGSTAAGGSSSSGGTTGAALKTASTSLGTVVVDSAGKTVYAFDKDTQNSGKSACTGGCAGLWPAVTTTGTSPTAAGVSAKLGTIARPDGTRQITLDGRPLYTYSGDSGAGAVAGQGVKGIWWAVTPGGAEITAAPAPAGY
jgi:predicted lipoprotein with Yx(FWY)xxD motif